MAGRIVLGIFNPALDTNGNVDSGLTLTFYQNNTTTPQAVYTDSTLGVALANPLSPDAAGRFPAIWAPDLTFYSVKVTPSGASPITYNDIENTNGTSGYSTGSWTPADASGAGLTITPAANSCKYIKIGKLVYVTANISYPITASGSTCLLSGLPFPVDSASYSVGSMQAIPTKEGAVPIGLINTSTFRFDYQAGGVILTNAQLSAKSFVFSFTYITS